MAPILCTISSKKHQVAPCYFSKIFLYVNKDLLEVAIPHLLNVDEKNRALLCMVFCKYQDVFPGILPTQAPPNQNLGDIHDIPLVEGAKPIQKSMYRHSP